MSKTEKKKYVLTKEKMWLSIASHIGEERNSFRCKQVDVLAMKRKSIIAPFSE